MLKSVEGVYRDGKIKLTKKPEKGVEARVIVTFIPKNKNKRRVDLRKQGIDEAHAQKLRTRLKTFADDWERPEMDAYDEL